MIERNTKTLIERITDKKKKQDITRHILEALPEWFEVEQSREQYIRECADWLYFAAVDDGKAVGFMCLKQTGKDTAELAVTGVLKEYHRKGLGRQMFEAARKSAADEGFSFMQVKTVRMGMYEDYDRTNKFYISLGFKEFEVFEDYWDKDNPCQIYVMSLK